MADKSIPELPAVEEKHIQDLPQLQEIYDDTLIPVSQNNEAHKMTGAQFREFGEKAAEVYVQTAEKAAESAVAAEAGAQGAAKAASDSVNQAKASEDKAKEYADTAKEYANQTAGNVPEVTVGWDVDGYFSWFENESEGT